MSADRLAALRYLRVPQKAPWRWEDNGGVLVWRDGTTIAFREEIHLVLERLAAVGAPPFTWIVCVLAACRGRYLETPDLPGKSTQGDAQRLTRVLGGRAKELALLQLKEISRLPADLIGTPQGKALLAQIVFEARTPVRTNNPTAILKGLALGLSDNELNTPSAEDPPLDRAATIRLVGEAIARHTPETLRERLRTGLDALPAAVPDIALPRSERARRLFAALEEDPDHHGLAVVVRDLLAAIRLPHVLSRPDEQALGGAAGLINRGPLDRLLLSELAHDDLTLASRVALNEALYVNREPPAHRPRRELAVLLDTGLRLWGVPRVLATATGLALVSRWPDGCEAKAWSHDGTVLNEVDLLDEPAMAAHLAVLNPALDSTEALSLFFARHAGADEVDAVIVTHRDTVQRPAFRSHLASAPFARGFVALVEQDGWVELHPLPLNAGRAVAQVRIDVEKLFETSQQKGTRTPVIDARTGTDLPAIFRARPFPLLLPVSTKIECAMRHGNGGLCVSADRRLFQWEDGKLGARVRATNLPGGRTCFLEADGAGNIVLVRGRDGTGRVSVVVVSADGSDPRVARMSASMHEPLHVRKEGGVVLVVLDRIVAVSLDTAEVLAETPAPPDLRWLSGRYYVDGTDLWFVSWGGAQARWDKVQPVEVRRVRDLCVAFEREGMGPWSLMADGRILSPTGRDTSRVSFGFDNARGWDATGKRIMLTATKTGAVHFLETDTLRVSHAVETEPSRRIEVAAPSRALQSKFRAICVLPGQGLRLLNAKGRWLEVFHAKGELRLVQSASSAASLKNHQLRFESVHTPRTWGHGLQVAKWPNGSRAWLDGRGLLHLRSHDASVPELTLVLGMGIPLATWTSDGRTSGPAFFTGQSPSQPSDAAAGVLERFCKLAW